MYLVYQKKISICLNKGREQSWGNGDVLALNNAERPRVRNGEDNIKQKMPDRTAWVEFVILIVLRYSLRYMCVQ